MWYYVEYTDTLVNLDTFKFLYIEEKYTPKFQYQLVASNHKKGSGTSSENSPYVLYKSDSKADAERKFSDIVSSVKIKNPEMYGLV